MKRKCLWAVAFFIGMYSVAQAETKAVNDSYSVVKNTVLNANGEKNDDGVVIPGFLDNDIIPEGESVIYELLKTPSHGTFDANSDDGYFTYTPDEGFTGMDCMLYALVSDDGLSEPAKVIFKVEEYSGAPASELTPLNDAYSVVKNTVLNANGEKNDDGVVIPGFLDNDIMPEDETIIYELLKTPSHGTFDANSDDGYFTYTPDEGFTGMDCMLYALVGDDGLSEPAKIIFTVEEYSGAPASELTPLNDSYSVVKNTVLNANGEKNDDGVVIPGFLDNDIMPEDETVIYELLKTPSHGTFDANSDDGYFTYTPDEGFTGMDCMLYALVGDDGLSEPAKIIFKVEEYSGAPASELTPLNDSYSVVKNTVLNANGEKNDDGVVIPGFLDNDIMPEDETVIYELLKTPSHGTFDANSDDGYFTYTPDEGFTGMDCMLYALVGDDGLSEPAKIIFKVEEYSGAPGDPTVTAGNTLKVNEKNVFKAFIQLNNTRFKAKVSSKSGNSTTILMPRKRMVRISKKELRNPVPSPQIEAELVLQARNGQSESMIVNLTPPQIIEYAYYNDKLALQGKYFGNKQRVYLLNEETKELIKLKPLKNSLKFKGIKGKASCMNRETGDSYLELNSKKTIGPGKYKVIIVSSIGIGSEKETGKLPEITISSN